MVLYVSHGCGPRRTNVLLPLAVPPVGSDIWTPMEKRLFKKAFCAHKKDFYLIHKTVRQMWVDWRRRGLASRSS